MLRMRASGSDGQEKLGQLAEVPTLSLFSGADEYVPQSIDKAELQDKFAAVLTHPLSVARIVEGAGHSLTGHEEEATDIMVDFIKTLVHQR